MNHNNNGNVLRINLVRHCHGTDTSRYRKHGPLQVSRHADLLGDIVPINDYDEFCITIDALLLMLSEIDMQYAICSLSIIATFGLSFLIFLLMATGCAICQPLIFQYFISMCAFPFASIFIFLLIVVGDFPKRKIRKEIRAK
jgi:hypothetical protein